MIAVVQKTVAVELAFVLHIRFNVDSFARACDRALQAVRIRLHQCARARLNSWMLNSKGSARWQAAGDGGMRGAFELRKKSSESILGRL